MRRTPNLGTQRGYGGGRGYGASVTDNPPTIDPIDDQTIDEDNSTSAIDVTVGDDITPVGDLIVTAASNNDALLPPATAFALGGSGANRTLTLTPAAEANGTATVTISVDDGVNTPTTASFLLTVNAVNDAPVNTVPGTQDVDLGSIDNVIDPISVADIDDVELTVTLSVTHGDISLASFDNLTFASGDGTHDTTMQFYGGITAINAALNGIKYFPASDYVGDVTLQIDTSDGTLTDSDTVTITVVETNTWIAGSDGGTSGITDVLSSPTSGGGADAAFPQRSGTNCYVSANNLNANGVDRSTFFATINSGDNLRFDHLGTSDYVVLAVNDSPTPVTGAYFFGNLTLVTDGGYTPTAGDFVKITKV